MKRKGIWGELTEQREEGAIGYVRREEVGIVSLRAETSHKAVLEREEWLSRMILVAARLSKRRGSKLWMDAQRKAAGPIRAARRVQMSWSNESFKQPENNDQTAVLGQAAVSKALEKLSDTGLETKGDTYWNGEGLKKNVLHEWFVTQINFKSRVLAHSTSTSQISASVQNSYYSHGVTISCMQAGAGHIYWPVKVFRFVTHEQRLKAKVWARNT